MYPAVCPAFFIGNEQEMAEKKLIWSECKSSRKKRGGCIWKYCLMKARAECDAHIYYVNRKEYVDWAVKVLTVVRSVWSTFSGEGASEWRESVHKEFIKTGITPKDYLDFVCSILHISRKVKIILLDGTVQEAKILDFLDMSYDLTDGRIEESIE